MDVRLENVSKTIRDVPVVQDVSLQFPSGVITGIKGINGSGKTMLMRLIAGLIRPTKGAVYIGEKRLWKDISFPESIGILIENPAFLDRFTAFDNLELLADLNRRITSDDIRKILDDVALSHAGKKKFRQFSLGMKQRLGIAAAVMEHPQVILLDEPTNALDSDGVDMVKALLRREKERGAVIVLSCHDYSILRELSDEIYEMSEGRITGKL